MSATAGCSNEPLEDADAVPQDITQAWSAIVCAGAPVEGIDPSFLEGDEVARSMCELDVNGTLMQKRQLITVLDSEAAVDTYMQGRDCANYLYVTGPNWVATGAIRELSTALVEAGGELCKG